MPLSLKKENNMAPNFKAKIFLQNFFYKTFEGGGQNTTTPKEEYDLNSNLFHRKKPTNLLDSSLNFNTLIISIMEENYSYYHKF